MRDEPNRCGMAYTRNHEVIAWRTFGWPIDAPLPQTMEVCRG